MTVARSMSPIKTHSTSPTLTYKTPSLLNINNQDDELKDAKIKELEETIMALRKELNQMKTSHQENGTASYIDNRNELQQEQEHLEASQDHSSASNENNAENGDEIETLVNIVE